MPGIRLEKLWVTLITHRGGAACNSTMVLRFIDVSRDVILAEQPYTNLVPDRGLTYEVEAPTEWELTTWHLRHQAVEKVEIVNMLDAPKSDQKNWRAGGVIIVGKDVQDNYYLFCLMDALNKTLKVGASELKLRMLIPSQVGPLVPPS